MKFPEVEEYLQRDDIVLIRVDATEQYGSHMPLTVDAAQAIDVTATVIEKTGCWPRRPRGSVGPPTTWVTEGR